MTWKLFYELTEIYTTPLDVAWLILAISYSYFTFGSYQFTYMLVAFFLVFAFHLIVNMQNNYMDYKNATDLSDYKQKTSTIGKHHLPLSLIRNWLIGLSIVPSIIALWLAYQTGITTLIIGVVSVSIGLLYSAGPRPINSTLFAESLISLAITFSIPLTYIYLGLPDHTAFSSQLFFNVLLITLPNILLGFVGLLANNTCDLKEDIANNRHTLVYFIGQQNAVRLFKIAGGLALVLIPLLVLLKQAPLTTLLITLLYPSVIKQVQPYFAKQIKSETFPLVVKAFSKIAIGYIVLFAIGTLIGY